MSCVRTSCGKLARRCYAEIGSLQTAPCSLLTIDRTLRKFKFDKFVKQIKNLRGINVDMKYVEKKWLAANEVCKQEDEEGFRWTEAFKDRYLASVR